MSFDSNQLNDLKIGFVVIADFALLWSTSVHEF